MYVVKTPSIGERLCCGHCNKPASNKQFMAHFKVNCSELSTVIIQHYRGLKMMYGSLTQSHFFGFQPLSKFKKDDVSEAFSASVVTQRIA